MDGAEKGNTSASDASPAAPDTITTPPLLTGKKLFLVVLCVDYSNPRAINRTILFLDHSFQHFSLFPWTRPSYQRRYQQLRPTLEQWRTFPGLRVLISFPRFTFISSAVEYHLLNCTLRQLLSCSSEKSSLCVRQNLSSWLQSQSSSSEVYFALLLRPLTF